jgi:lysophospholipase L1-like esterase
MNLYPNSKHTGSQTRSSPCVPGWFICCLIVTLTGFSAAPARSDTAFASGKPAVRVEYWQNRQAEISASLQDGSKLSAVKLLFLGDSITDFWSLGDNPWVSGQKCGRAIWDESFSGRPPENRGLNLGISGDRTEHVLYRILPKAAGGLGELDSADLNPEFVILLVGINNTWAAEAPVADSVFAGIEAVISAVHERKPKARVILQSLLPTMEESKNREVVVPVNRRLLELSSSRPYSDYVVYLDLYAAFVDSRGQQLSQYFNDGLHPNESGYRVWRDQLVPFLSRARASTAHAR